jgi:hypothetical protein
MIAEESASVTASPTSVYFTSSCHGEDEKYASAQKHDGERHYVTLNAWKWHG